MQYILNSFHFALISYPNTSLNQVMNTLSPKSVVLAIKNFTTPSTSKLLLGHIGLDKKLINSMVYN